MDENHISEFVERELSEWNKGNNMLTRVKELIRGAYLAGYAEALKDSEASERIRDKKLEKVREWCLSIQECGDLYRAGRLSVSSEIMEILEEEEKI